MALDAKRNNLLKERCVELEFKVNKLGIVGRAYWEASQIKLRRNRMLIRAARTTNMLLHSALQVLQAKELAARKEAAGLTGIRKQAATLRSQFDEERGKSIALQILLQSQITDTRAAEIDCADVLDPNTPTMERIRLLDARLVAIFAKTKNVQMVEVHFEDLLKPMREEKAVFAGQIDSLTHVIDMKRRQMMQLGMVLFDSNKSRLQAKKELEELINIWFAGQKHLVGPEMQKKILRAVRKIKVVMEVDSMRSMYSHYMFQEKQVTYLEAVKKDLQISLAQLRSTAEIPKAYQRKESLPINEVFSLADNTKSTIYKAVDDLKSRKNSYPLILIVEGTKKLVDKLHIGSEGLAERGFTEQLDTMFKIENRLILLLTQLHKKMEYLMDLHAQVKKQQEEEKAKAVGLAPPPLEEEEHQPLPVGVNIVSVRTIPDEMPPPSLGFAQDDQNIKYEGHTKKTYEEIMEQKEKEKNSRPKTPPKQSPY